MGLAAKPNALAAMRWIDEADKIIDSDMPEEEAQAKLANRGDFTNLNIAFANSMWRIIKGDYAKPIKAKSEDLTKQNKVFKGRQLY